MEKKKFKILHISQEKLTLKDTISGIKTVLLDEIEYENLNNIDAKLYAISKKIEENKEICINKKNLKEDILEYNPDIVIFHGFYIFKHILIAKYLKRLKIPYYIKPHGGFNKQVQKKSSLKKNIARKLFFDEFVENSDGLIFLNTQEQKNSIYRSKKELILSNGIKKLLKYNKNLKSDQINVIYLGRFDFYYKRLDILFNMIIKNKEELKKMNIKFKFFGLGEEIKNLEKVKEFVDVSTPIYEERKYRELSNSDIMILISRCEGMPMSILEALAVGTPCFITKETGMAEWIKRYNCGWIINDTNDLWRDFRQFIIEYKKNREIYIENSKKCSEEFLWDNLIKLYLKEYKKLGIK